MQTLLNYIDGEFVAASGRATLEVFEPATGEAYAVVAESAPADLDPAIDSAERAAPAWARTPAAERAAWLHRIADGIEARFEEFARAESRDTGKPLGLARALDIPRAITNLRFFAGAATQFASESHAMESGAINYTLRQPHGVVGCISPWNLPLYLFTWKIAPALAAGNCVIAKPSELTPATA
ncbi:MAG TPA: aldehyde dehydrogenase family protein, partial [Steroidobacteraceae bacterium]|nr:aldehyde dehydrogenase family protein [Steroidobacteraceae bacterium]